MGFGTLFIGYFLLLNITAHAYTDLIAGLVMLLGLYKLSRVVRGFIPASYAAAAFSVYGLLELALSLVEVFFPAIDLSAYLGASAIIRAVIICLLTVLMLSAMEKLARELDVERLPARCRAMTVWTAVLYISEILLESTLLTRLLPPQASAILYLVVIIGMLVVVVANLLVIYTCYMRICMPEDLKPKAPRPSRWKWVNEFRRRREERQEAEAEAFRREQDEKRRRKKKK